jgi:nitroreductase
METWDAIRSRRGVRLFTDAEIPFQDLEQILEAGRRSPSSTNSQRWDFVLIREREQLARVAGVWRGASHLVGAAAGIGIVAPFSDDQRVSASINFDLGQAAMSMMIAAADLGIGSRNASVHDYDLAREVLGLPEDLRLTWLLSFGYPADRPLKPIRKPDRRPFDEVVHLERW